MVIDHICFAVRNTAKAIAHWEEVFGYKQMTGTVENKLQKVLVTFMKKEGSIPVKLIEPAEGNAALMSFINRNGGFHHICFRCGDVNTTITDLKEKGLVLLTPPQPGEAFNNSNIAFMLSTTYGINIELIDTSEKAAML